MVSKKENVDLAELQGRVAAEFRDLPDCSAYLEIARLRQAVSEYQARSSHSGISIESFGPDGKRPTQGPFAEDIRDLKIEQTEHGLSIEFTEMDGYRGSVHSGKSSDCAIVLRLGPGAPRMGVIRREAE